MDRAYKVLLVEDDKILATTLQRTLVKRGWSVALIDDGARAQLAWQETKPDLILLDLSLPNIDGLDLLTLIRRSGNFTPVMILTARGTVGDKILGLNHGADDYLPKPFDLDELEARMRALLRRIQKTTESDSKTISFGQLSLDRDSGALYLNGEILDIAPREASMLQALVERAGRAMRKEQLFEQVFRNELEVNLDAIEVVAYRLRKRLTGSNVELVTLRGLGYLLKLVDEY
jgi:two-component system, OmpR family, response regulator TctD